jgi:hypothetical protein
MTSKYTLIFFGLACLLTLLPQSCENNNIIDLYGIQECDITNITWDSKISAILDKYCVRCHGPEISYNGVRHDTYTYELIVVNDGRLKRVINDEDPSTRMPKNEDPLDSCTLKIINYWIKDGAPEN